MVIKQENIRKQITLPKDILTEVTEDSKKSSMKVNYWILQAIKEKLQKTEHPQASTSKK